MLRQCRTAMPSCAPAAAIAACTAILLAPNAHAALTERFAIGGSGSPSGDLDGSQLQDVEFLDGGEFVVAGYESGLDDSPDAGADPFVAKYRFDGTRVESFGRDGRAVLPLGPGRDRAWDVDIDAQGRIYVAGTQDTDSGEDAYVARLTAAGEVDEGFGDGGVAIIDLGDEVEEDAWHLAVNPAGGVYAVGSSGAPFSTSEGAEAFLAKLDATGDPVPGFGQDGIVTWRPDTGSDRDSGVYSAITRQPDNGKLIVVGHRQTENENRVPIAHRRNPMDGSFDSTFGGDGRIGEPPDDDPVSSSYQLWDVELAAQGRIVAAGYGFDVSDLAEKLIFVAATRSGQLDTTFGDDDDGGIALDPGAGFDSTFEIEFDDEGRVLIAGRTIDEEGAEDRFLARLTAAGEPDDAFGDEGVRITDSADDDLFLAIAHDGGNRIVAVGSVDNDDDPVFDAYLIRGFTDESDPLPEIADDGSGSAADDGGGGGDDDGGDAPSFDFGGGGGGGGDDDDGAASGPALLSLLASLLRRRSRRERATAA